MPNALILSYLHSRVANALKIDCKRRESHSGLADCPGRRCTGPRPGARRKHPQARPGCGPPAGRTRATGGPPRALAAGPSRSAPAAAGPRGQGTTAPSAAAPPCSPASRSAARLAQGCPALSVRWPSARHSREARQDQSRTTRPHKGNEIDVAVTTYMITDPRRGTGREACIPADLHLADAVPGPAPVAVAQRVGAAQAELQHPDLKKHGERVSVTRTP